MTVKDRVGRKRYISIDPDNDRSFYIILKNIRNSSIVNYRGLKAIRIKHFQLEDTRKLASKYNIKISMVSGTLKSLKSKVYK